MLVFFIDQVGQQVPASVVHTVVHYMHKWMCNMCAMSVWSHMFVVRHCVILPPQSGSSLHCPAHIAHSDCVFTAEGGRRSLLGLCLPSVTANMDSCGSCLLCSWMYHFFFCTESSSLFQIQSVNKKSAKLRPSQIATDAGLITRLFTSCKSFYIQTFT